MPRVWIEALKEWNKDKPMWCIPKKGSAEIDVVRKIAERMKAPPKTEPVKRKLRIPKEPEPEMESPKKRKLRIPKPAEVATPPKKESVPTNKMEAPEGVITVEMVRAKQALSGKKKKPKKELTAAQKKAKKARSDKNREYERKLDDATIEIEEKLNIGDVVIDDEEHRYVVISLESERNIAEVKRIGGNTVFRIQGGGEYWEEYIPKEERDEYPKDYEPRGFSYMIKKDVYNSIKKKSASKPLKYKSKDTDSDLVKEINRVFNDLEALGFTTKKSVRTPSDMTRDGFKDWIVYQKRDAADLDNRKTITGTRTREQDQSEEMFDKLYEYAKNHPTFSLYDDNEWSIRVK